MTIFTFAVPSGPPQSTDSLALSSTSLVLMWELPLLEQQNGPIVGYYVRVTRVHSGDILEWDTNSTVVTVDSLVPYTLYEWRVAAQTIAGTGPLSSPVTEQTLPDGKQLLIVLSFEQCNFFAFLQLLMVLLKI